MQGRADFVIELGDYVDTLVDDKDPIEKLLDIESIYERFEGPRYHVLGNHEFDNLTRDQLLYNIENTDIPTGETYYSFDPKGVHCVVLDADYTVEQPHQAFDLQDPDDPFWNWTNAWISQVELDWLAADLAASNLPTVVFTHQILHRDNSEDHTIKNADVVRGIFEQDGQVVAVLRAMTTVVR
jgi:alkaline phosphatase